MIKYLIVSLILFPNIVSAADLPKNSHPNVYGTGWTCDRGFYKSGDKCVKVIVPENASLDIYGSGWACNRGYYKSGNKCFKVIVPENASIDMYGSGWACNRGYYKSGNKCVKVIVPENASIDMYGSGWACNKGYKKLNNVCVAMTNEELQKQKEQEKALILEMQRRRAQGVSGDDCETEYKTGAEVCVSISGIDIDCNKSYAGEYYQDCDVTLNYEIHTDYKGGSYIEAEVECTVDIEYKGRNTYSTQSDSSSQDESHSLYAHGSDSGTMNFNFSFSSLNEITKVEIDSSNCEIEDVNMY